MLVVDRDGVCSPVSLLVLRDHHRDGQCLETFTWKWDANVSAVWEVGVVCTVAGRT